MNEENQDMELKPGDEYPLKADNRYLLKVENIGTGGFFYCALISEETGLIVKKSNYKIHEFDLSTKSDNFKSLYEKLL